MNIDLLKQLLIIAITVSVITCSFIQKTKGIVPSSKWIGLYSFVVNMGISIVFCLSFTNLEFIQSIWVGAFSFIGADTLYKSLEGKLKPFSDIVAKTEVKKDDEYIEIEVDR